MRKNDTIFVLDDEPFYLDWLFEYIGSLGYKYVSVTTIDEALTKLRKDQYRIVIVDLNVPAEENLLAELDKRGAVYREYPGLIVADFVRNHDHTGRRVIVYSVHDRQDVKRETERLRCTYMLKGRPRAFKEEIKDVLSYDPLTRSL